MTPFKVDCINVRPTRKEVYLADGTKIFCNTIGDIIIPILCTKGSKYVLRLKEVLIIPELDRRLFSVSSFLKQGNSWMSFQSTHIELGMKAGPVIHVPITSLQSIAMVANDETTVKVSNITASNKNEDESVSFKRKRISSDVIHSRFHKTEGVLATINSEGLWEDVLIIPSVDKFCTSCKITSIPHAARSKTRTSTPKSFLEEIQVDTVPNPEPLGVSAETRYKFFLIFCDRYSRIFRISGMKDKTSLECAKAIEGILSRIPNSTSTAKDITHIRSDTGTEFRSNDFNDWCKENSIVFTTAAPKHQEQNGMVERHWAEVSKLANIMLVHARLSTKFIM